MKKDLYEISYYLKADEEKRTRTFTVVAESIGKALEKGLRHLKTIQIGCKVIGVIQLEQPIGI